LKSIESKHPVVLREAEQLNFIMTEEVKMKGIKMEEPFQNIYLLLTEEDQLELLFCYQRDSLTSLI